MFKHNKFNAYIRLILLTTLILTSISSLLSGCNAPKTPFIEGTYVTSEVDGSCNISKLKLNLTEVDKDAFQNADGRNVIEAYVSAKESHYYAFELFLYVDDVGDYRQLDIIGFERQKGAPHTYYGRIESSQDDLGVSGFTFIYAEPIQVLLYQNGSECRFYLKLQEN